jgi:hypothetical protein
MMIGSVLWACAEQRIMLGANGGAKALTSSARKQKGKRKETRYPTILFKGTLSVA